MTMYSQTEMLKNLLIIPVSCFRKMNLQMSGIHPDRCASIPDMTLGNDM